MPKVGTKRFPYTPAGEKQAKEYGKKTGQKVVYTKGKSTKKSTKKPMY